MYIGVHVPKSYHRRRRHRRKSSHKEKRERVEHNAEGYKSDADNVDETSANILKPLSEWKRRARVSTVNFPKRVSPVLLGVKGATGRQGGAPAKKGRKRKRFNRQRRWEQVDLLI